MDKKKTTEDAPADNGSLLSSEPESLEYQDDASTSSADDTPAEAPADNATVSGGDADGSLGTVHQAPGVVTNAVTHGQDKKPRLHLGPIWERINIYLVLFVFIVIACFVGVAYIYFRNKTASETGTASDIASQKLSTDSLEQLASNGVQIGDPKQVLNIQSNAVFAGTALVKGELQVAGGLKIGSGDLTIPGANISGTAIINNLQTQTVAVSGNTAIQGQLSVQRNLTVTGTGSFTGALTAPQLTTSKLQLSGDLTLSRHIVAGGSIPGRTNGGSLGSGGTSSVSGSDTAGTVTINTGGGAAAGCMVTINFSQAFAATPHVVLTPVGPGAAKIGYYTNRSVNSFSVCSADAPPSNASFGFDYLVLE